MFKYQNQDQIPTPAEGATEMKQLFPVSDWWHVIEDNNSLGSVSNVDNVDPSAENTFFSWWILMPWIIIAIALCIVIVYGFMDGQCRCDKKKKSIQNAGSRDSFSTYPLRHEVDAAARLDLIASAEYRGEEPLTYENVTKQSAGDYENLMFDPTSETLSTDRRTHDTKLSMEKLKKRYPSWQKPIIEDELQK